MIQCNISVSAKRNWIFAFSRWCDLYILFRCWWAFSQELLFLGSSIIFLVHHSQVFILAIPKHKFILLWCVFGWTTFEFWVFFSVRINWYNKYIIVPLLIERCPCKRCGIMGSNHDCTTMFYRLDIFLLLKCRVSFYPKTQHVHWNIECIFWSYLFTKQIFTSLLVCSCDFKQTADE